MPEPRPLALRPAALWIAAWGLLVAVAFATRPPFPVDETRYASVAWEMWQRGDLLLPVHNGAPYSHKPPLLFWLIQGGWWLFGVNDWWPRLVPSLFALGDLSLTALLARRLWGIGAEEGTTAPLVLIGLLGWAFYTTVLTFDMLVVFCVLVALYGLLRAAGGAERSGWVLFALGVGLGLLAKGPVALLFTLPPALAAPWWAEGGLAGRRGRWYLDLTVALGLGAVIALAWALPAAREGGPEYRRLIFLAQTTDRLVRAETHRAPWWWYLSLLPALLFPYGFWPDLWRRLVRLRSTARPQPLRFLLAWIAPAFVLLTAISSKRPHYLLALLPAVALVAARAVRGLGGRTPVSRLAGPLAATAVLGVLVAAAPWLLVRAHLPAWGRQVTSTAGLLLLAAAGSLALMRRRQLPAIPTLTALNLLFLILFHLGPVAIVGPAYDVRPMASYLSYLEKREVPVAFLGTYHDQFQFAGRLARPLELIGPATAPEWLRQHPGGRVVAIYADQPPPDLGTPEFAHPYGPETSAVWSAAAVAAARVPPDG